MQGLRKSQSPKAPSSPSLGHSGFQRQLWDLNGKEDERGKGRIALPGTTACSCLGWRWETSLSSFGFTRRFRDAFSCSKTHTHHGSPRHSLGLRGERCCSTCIPFFPSCQGLQVNSLPSLFQSLHQLVHDCSRSSCFSLS